ncbi:MAG: CCA tRNA nucleotidyltransferase [Phycisphaerales bacterium JB060]
MTTQASHTPDARAAARAVVSHLRGQGHEAYFAGGCVRDELLGLKPGDYDVATDATPQRLESLFHGARLVGAQFGVVQVRKLGVWTEVATFRSDGTYTDRRRPDEVTFSDAQSDAERRDFTINAMFLDPLADESDWTQSPRGEPIAGRVIDLVGGLADLRAGVVRAVGAPHRRLAEDHLRALRAVRFAARLGFEIEPDTAHAIAEHAYELEGVSRERIGAELRRMLAHRSRSRAVAILDTLGLDGPALEQPPAGAGQDHLRLRSLREEARVPLALAAWILDRGHGLTRPTVRPTVSRLRSALCLSNAEASAILACLARRLDILDHFEKSERAQQKRLAASEGFSDALELLRVEAGELTERVSARVTVLAAETGGLSPPRLVTGEDLIEHGQRPGPDFASMLEYLYDLQLEDSGRDRAWLLEHLATLGVHRDGTGPRAGKDPQQN